MIVGILFAFLTALMFALSVVYIRKNIGESNFLSVTFVTTIVGCLVLPFLAIVMAGSSFSILGALIFMFAGFLHPGLSRLAYFKGVEKVGVCMSASIFASYPMFSTILALLLLGENPTMWTMVGVVCVVFGAVLVQSNMRSTPLSKKAFLLFPFFASIVSGAAYVAKKIGLSFYADPVAGVALAYLSGFLLYLVLLGFSRSVRENVSIDRRNFSLFWKAGLGMCVGTLFSFYALKYGEVTFVVPLFQIEPLLVLIITYFYLKGVETVSWRVIYGAISTILGITLITIF